MRMPLHPAALKDLSEAVGWYEQREAGLGSELLGEIEAAVEAIAEAPERWPLFDEATGTRGYMVSRLPYRLFYRPTGDVWQIIAIAHGSRQPDYWRRRT